MSDQVYPWTGTYFENVPVTLTAIAKPGYKFVRWKEINSTSATVTVNLTNDLTLTAMFEMDFSSQNGQLVLYPNPPLDGKVYMNDFYRVTVYDITGKEVLAEQTTKELNVSQLAKGIYFVRDETGLQAKFVVLNNVEY